MADTSGDFGGFTVTSSRIPDKVPDIATVAVAKGAASDIKENLRRLKQHISYTIKKYWH